MWRNVAVAALLALAVGTVLGAGHADATLSADVAVAGRTCDAGNITALTLSVDYRGRVPVRVTPHVWSARQHVQFAWTPTTIRLRPGTQTVRIHAPDARAVIREPPVQVYLAAGQRRAITNWAGGRC